MGKTLGYIALFVCPILFVIGLFRYFGFGALDVEAPFLPDYDTFYKQMNEFPDLSKFIGQAITQFNNSRSLFLSQAIKVNDPISFFTAVGAFFGQIGAAFAIAFRIIACPFMVIGWVFSSLFNFTFVANNPTSTEDANLTILQSLQFSIGNTIV